MVLFIPFYTVRAPHVRPNGNVGSAIVDHNLTADAAAGLAANFPGAQVAARYVAAHDGPALDSVSEAIMEANDREGFTLPAPTPVLAALRFYGE
jgi:hypothetical protein